MFIKSCVVVVACYSFVIIQTVLPKAMALRKSPDVNEFMVENQRAHRRQQNYVVKRALKDEILGIMDTIGPAYITEPFEPDTSPEELILDYDNRNDIIFVDNSVKRTSLKRGNKKTYNQAAVPDIQGPPCSCVSNTVELNLGADTYPQFLDSVNCSTAKCSQSYRCKETYYYVTVLTKKIDLETKSQERLPTLLDLHWIPSKVNVTTGCVCIRDSIVGN